MNFNQLTAAAAAASNPNMNMNSFANAVTNILANSNIDLSQLASMTQLGSQLPLTQAVNIGQASARQQSSRQNLQQAHHHRSGLNSTGGGGGGGLNSNSSHLPSSMANLEQVDAQTSLSANLANLGLPASITNLTSSALAAGAAAAAAAAHQPSGAHRNSLHSAHHRSSSSSSSSNNNNNNNHHHHNHHSSSSSSSSAQLTAAHQSTSANKSLGGSHTAQNTIHHHRHSSSLSHQQQQQQNSHHNNSLSNHNNINNINSTSLNNLIGNSIINNSNSHQTIIATNNTNPITPPKASTCYRIGDCIYFETSPTLPLQIGRIDEICKTNGDNIEVKVVVFFRRRDISSSLMTLADKYQYDESQEDEIKQMSEKEKNLLKQRELFYSRQIETLPASSIKGKCTVQLLNESESLASYLNKDDYYFYTLVYDPAGKTISADRGEIRVGQRYQAEAQPNPVYTPQAGGDPSDPRDLNEMETLVYTPDHNLTDDDINKFLTIAKSVGTFARALDCSSSIKQPSLHLTAASASRDVTLLYAMQLLHQNNYDLGKAVCALVPSTGPVLCRDEIEEWTAGEATLFEEAIEKYGREFGDIRQDFLPWKSVKNIVEYYYMWKTTDRSINQRRMKALEAESKVSVIYITNPEQENEIKKSPNNVSAASGPDANNLDSQGKPRSLRRPQESDESSLNSSMENTNATLKRRQVTEPKLSAHVACHTTPGENLRFISTKRHKQLRRGLISRTQLRHLSRRPWERRAKSKA